MIRDRIVAGIIDNSLRTRLLGTTNLTLDTCVEKVRMNEATQEQSAVMGKTVTTTVAVDALHTKQQHNQNRFKGKKSYDTNSRKHNGSKGDDRQNKNTDGSTSAHTNTNSNDKGKQRGRCTYCGTTHQPRKCPAYGKTCHKCKRNNHFSSVCVAKTVACLSADDESNESESDVYIINTLDAINVNEIETAEKSWIERIKVEEKEMPFKVDSGAGIDVLPLSMMEKIKGEIEIRQTKIKLRPYVGNCINVYGECFLTCSHAGKSTISRFAIVDKDVTPILGLNTCRKLGILPEPKERNK